MRPTPFRTVLLVLWSLVVAGAPAAVGAPADGAAAASGAPVAAGATQGPGASASLDWAAGLATADGAAALAAADGAPALAAAEGAPAGRVPPRPVEVSEVDDAPGGELVVEPAQVGLTLQPATADLVDLRVVNGSDTEVSLDVEVMPVGAGPGGAPQVPAEGARDGETGGAPDGEAAGAESDGEGAAGSEGDGAAGGDPVPSAADWFDVPTLEVHLAPSEAAAYRPAVTVPEGTEPGGYLAAVRFVDRGAASDERGARQDADGSDDEGDDGEAGGGGGAEVVAFVLVHVPGDDGGGDDPELSVSLQRVDPTTAVATATLDAGRRGAVDVTGDLRVRSWYGTTLVRAEIPTTLVLPTVPRERVVELRAPVIPGPYTVSVEAEGPGVTFGSASGRSWLWNPAAVIALALLLLLATAWLLYRTVRGR